MILSIVFVCFCCFVFVKECSFMSILSPHDFQFLVCIWLILVDFVPQCLHIWVKMVKVIRKFSYIDRVVEHYNSQIPLPPIAVLTSDTSWTDPQVCSCWDSETNLNSLRSLLANMAMRLCFKIVNLEVGLKIIKRLVLDDFHQVPKNSNHALASINTNRQYTIINHP